ncbi:N-6 DNA methylase [candidate division WOR-3 bacterium]|nr:N-6 DNA methylase [candidate division WOR-3 bacterium]
MGTQNRRSGKAGAVVPNSSSRDFEAQRVELQHRLDSKSTQQERNRMGQFATPPKLARDIAASALSLLGPNERIKYLEPGLGTGAFYSALTGLVARQRVETAVGYEKDPRYARATANLWRDRGLVVREEDFTTAAPPGGDASRFNLVVCNPPYVRHHYITQAAKLNLQARCRRAGGVTLSGLTGLYGYFLVLAHAWMSENAVAAWLVPSEFMDVGYGAAIREYLLKKVTVLRIHRFDPADVQFEDALVSSAVLWLRRRSPEPNHPVVFTQGGSLDEPRTTRAVPAVKLTSEAKWTRFPQRGVRTARAGFTLGDLFEIKRGIATGSNKFFILSGERIEALQLPMECFRPILPGPRYLKEDVVRSDDEGWPVVEPHLFLLDCSEDESKLRKRHPTLWRYLQTGTPDVATRYLCRHRDPWYTQELRRPAPLLCTYIGRRGKNGRPFRFILNHSCATSHNVYLMLYPKPALRAAMEHDSGLLERIWQKLNSLSADTLLQEGRVYGGGMHKLEPKELAKVPMHDVVDDLPSVRRAAENALPLFASNA